MGNSVSQGLALTLFNRVYLDSRCIRHPASHFLLLCFHAFTNWSLVLSTALPPHTIRLRIGDPDGWIDLERIFNVWPGVRSRSPISGRSNRAHQFQSTPFCLSHADKDANVLSDM